jgi:hypothetical protein
MRPLPPVNHHHRGLPADDPGAGRQLLARLLKRLTNTVLAFANETAVLRRTGGQPRIVSRRAPKETPTLDTG